MKTEIITHRLPAGLMLCLLLIMAGPACKKYERLMAVRTVSINQYSLLATGEVIDVGGVAPEYGFCISTSQGHGTDSLVKIATTSQPITFEKTLAGLKQGRTYYICSYVKNGQSIEYGTQIQVEVSSSLVTYQYDDGTDDGGWRFNPGNHGWLGNLFPVTVSGKITGVEMYFSLANDAGTEMLRVDFFNASQLQIGNTNWFLPPSDGWITIPCPDISFSGNFFAMVFWDYPVYGTNYLGCDETGPNVYMDLAYYYDGTTWSTMSSVPPDYLHSIFLLRVTAEITGNNDSPSTVILEPGSSSPAISPVRTVTGKSSITTGSLPKKAGR
jgi:hypothetical protein